MIRQQVRSKPLLETFSEVWLFTCICGAPTEIPRPTPTTSFYDSDNAPDEILCLTCGRTWKVKRPKLEE